jgi:hypothetical protein
VTEFLYNASGTWIAFRVSPSDHYLYNKSAKWIGWFPWGDEDAVTKHGKYLGTLVGDRLLRRSAQQSYRGYPGYPGYPGYRGYPGYPGHVGYRGRPSGFVDVPDNLLTPE